MTSAEDRSALEIEQEIERTREDMDATIDAIKRKLSPKEIVDRAADYLRNNSGDIKMNFGQTLKDNPIPFALVGLGLGWLLVSGRSQRSVSHARSEESYEGFYGNDGDAAAGVASTVKRKASEAYEGISDTVADVIDEISAKTSAAMDSVSERTHAAIDMTADTAKQHPLMLGAAGLAVGVAVALMLPRTRQEDGVIGKARDRVIDQVKEVGKETVQKAKDVASDAWEAAKQTVVDEVLPQKDKGGSTHESPSAVRQADVSPGGQKMKSTDKPAGAGNRGSSGSEGGKQSYS